MEDNSKEMYFCQDLIDIIEIDLSKPESMVQSTRRRLVECDRLDRMFVPRRLFIFFFFFLPLLWTTPPSMSFRPAEFYQMVSPLGIWIRRFLIIHRIGSINYLNYDPTYFSTYLRTNSKSNKSETKTENAFSPPHPLQCQSVFPNLYQLTNHAMPRLTPIQTAKKS
jgi:hypothetical protein